MESAHMFIGFISILPINDLPVFFKVFTEVANHGAFISAFFHVKFPFTRLVLAGLCILPYEPSLRDPVLEMRVWQAKPLR